MGKAAKAQDQIWSQEWDQKGRTQNKKQKEWRFKILQDSTR